MKIKAKKPNLTIILCLAVIVVAVVSIPVHRDAEFGLGASEILTLATAIIGVITLGGELRRTKNIAEAEFIVSLNTNFVTNSDYCHLYDLCEKYDFENNPDLDVPTSKISNYLTFFETFELLLERGVLKIDMFDDLFAYRFFLIIQNPYVQRVKLIKSPKNFVNIYRLEKKWMDYRHSHQRACYKENYSLKAVCEKENKMKEYNENVNIKK